MTGADQTNLVFAQRHEANAVELFFDLFFAANLATFTTYHSITDTSYLLAYMGFFGIVWSCWFQVTLHDVRFARDSIYERTCKFVQFIVFVGLALVGSGFTPGSAKASNTNFRILCFVLVLSRVLFVVQYGVVLFYTIRERYSKLYLPLALHMLIYGLGAAAFGAMTPAFRAQQQSHRAIYVVWYIVMLAEAVGVIIISCYWKMLSFKKTHLMERMSLLTLIVIGEGAIGVTKTVSRLMGKSGLDVESCFIVICIIGVLVMLWALYFDNFPHGHYGTIRQQVWSLLHFPLQLAIVGVVEGSQQMALANYMLRSTDKILTSLDTYCITQNLDGAALRDQLLFLADYWQFESKSDTLINGIFIDRQIYNIGNSTGICSPANVTSYIANVAGNPLGVDVPQTFMDLIGLLFEAIYIQIGAKPPVDKLKTLGPIGVAWHSYRTVYIYYWCSICLFIGCSIAFLFLIRRHRADIFDWMSVIIRVFTCGVGAALLAFIAPGNNTAFFNFVDSPAVIPVVLGLFLLITLIDRFSAVFANYRLKKSGAPYALEYHKEHHHQHQSGHGTPHMVDPYEPLKHADGNRKSAAWSVHHKGSAEPLTEPLNADTAYRSHVSPPPVMGEHQMQGPVLSGGYVPVGRTEYGA